MISKQPQRSGKSAATTPNQQGQYIKGLFEANRPVLMGFISQPGREQQYSQLAEQIGVSDDDALKLLRMANARQSVEPEKPVGYEWPTLIDLDTPELPTLDLSLFPGWMGNFASATAAATETPPELAGGMTLAVVSAAAARRIVVKINDGYREPTCLWVAAGLEPANLKSAVVGACLTPLQEWERAQEETIGPEIRQAKSELKTKEARVKALRAAAASVKTKAVDVQRYTDEITTLEQDLQDVPVMPRLWTSDATPETFGAMLGQQGECMALISSEGAIIDIMAGRYTGGAPNIDLFLKGHAGDSDVTDRLSRDSVRLNFPRISMGISPQPDVFNALALIKGAEGRGLLARFLYLLPPSKLGYRTLNGPPTPTAIKQQYQTGVNSMLNWSVNTSSLTGCYEVELSDKAHAKWHQFRVWVESEMRPDGSLSNYKKWAGKAGGAAVRIAGVMHSAKHAHEEPWRHLIDAETMSSALEVLAVIMEHSKAVLSAMGADESMNNARTVLAWLRSKQTHSMTVRDIHLGLKHKLPTAKIVKEAVSYLEERGYLYTVEQAPTGGRAASAIVVIRPEILRPTL